MREPLRVGLRRAVVGVVLALLGTGVSAAPPATPAPTLAARPTPTPPPAVAPRAAPATPAPLVPRATAPAATPRPPLAPVARPSPSLTPSVAPRPAPAAPASAPAPTAPAPKPCPTPWSLNPKGDTLVLNRPMGLAFDTRGQLFVADLINRRIRCFEPGAGFPLPASLEAGLLVPWGLTVDATDRLYVADTGRHQVIVLERDGKQAALIGKRGTAPGEFFIPADVAVDAPRNRLLVADFANHAVQILTLDGTYLQHLGDLGKPGRTEGLFRGPAGVAVDAAGRIYVSDKENCRVQVFHANGGFIGAFGQPGAGPAHFDRPTGLALDDEGALAVCDTFNNRVQLLEPLFNSAMEPLFRVRCILDGRTQATGKLNLPNKCAFSPRGDLYVADTGNNRVVAWPRALLRPAP